MPRSVKKKPVAKKKRQAEIAQLVSPEAQRKADRELRNYIGELDDRSEERHKYVQAILDANGEEVARSVNVMVETLERMHGEPTITYQGRVYNSLDGEIEMLKRIQARNFMYLAVRVLVACAEWDIQIADFKAPAKLCLRCATPVKIKKKGKKKRG